MTVEEMIDKFHKEDSKRKRKKTMRKVRAKHYTNFNYKTEGK